MRAHPWHLPTDEFIRVIVVLEDDQGEVATIECGPELVDGQQTAPVRVRIGQAPVTPEARASVLNAEFVGRPLVEITAGYVKVRRRDESG
jgi:hypothetical protein